MDEAKREIIQRFMKNVYGKTSDVSGSNSGHDGKYGHWLETQMGIAHNGDNAPDLFGYEMKNDTSSGKTTFGDWSPNESIFSNNAIMSREDFIKTFGHPSKDKPKRWSWSGEPVPKINKWNNYGQTLHISEEKDIQVIYDYSHDKRQDKSSIVPDKFKSGEHVLMAWTSMYMRSRVERKFNQKGWFKCLMDNGVYKTIAFGNPFTFDEWLKAVGSGQVYLDSGMYHDDIKPNVRPYMQWRADNAYWNFLIQERYPN
ncbi:LlaMI family restriction endonuclease [bacterium]|nr:LlaMI family restriction endonuclease [bacterium]